MDFPLLQARQLCFTYGERPVLRDLDLELAAGSCTLIQGDNGAGKSSLLQLLQGRLQPSAGSVHLAGRPLRGQRQCVSQAIYLTLQLLCSLKAVAGTEFTSEDYILL